jgi:hypothetical protein
MFSKILRKFIDNEVPIHVEGMDYSGLYNSPWGQKNLVPSMACQVAVKTCFSQLNNIG